ncbi:MAG: tetratricopeptide repeat protein [Methanothrix sp.]|nr:MAG: tetratricopeptide repeat protein [Methanothrix sp.]
MEGAAMTLADTLMEDIRARLPADPVTWERLKAALEMSAGGWPNGHLCYFRPVGKRISREHFFESMKLILVAFILLLQTVPVYGQQTADDFFNEGNALCMQDKYDEAIKYYDEAIRLDPRNTAALNNKVNALNALRRTTEGDAAITKAEELSETVEDWFNKGVDLYAQGKYDDAIISALPLPGATKAVLLVTRASTTKPMLPTPNQ